MATESARLSLVAPLPSERIARLTRDLQRELGRVGVTASAPTEEPALRTRGEPVTLGVLALALVTSGVITALLECLKAVISREKKLTVKITGTTGGSIEIDAQNVSSPEIELRLKQLFG
jgi:hypothetical protein